VIKSVVHDKRNKLTPYPYLCFIDGFWRMKIVAISIILIKQSRDYFAQNVKKID